MKEENKIKIFFILYFTLMPFVMILLFVITFGAAFPLLVYMFKQYYTAITYKENKRNILKIWFEDENVIMRRVPSTQKNMEALWPYVTVEHKKNDRPYWVTKDKRKQKKVTNSLTFERNLLQLL